jgi:tRNA threonylcarbamoyl adenosine modification protein YjeE
VFSANESETRTLAAQLATSAKPGDVFLLDGPLGAGKTTFVRGFLEALGHDGPVRSPTFNLLQTFETEPPVMHADLYRVKSWQGIGLEDYLETHMCLIEWPDRAMGLVDPMNCWRIDIAFSEGGRSITIQPPNTTLSSSE